MMIQPTQLYGFEVLAGVLMAKNPCNPRLKNPVILSNLSSCLRGQIICAICDNSWSINDLRACKPLYNCKETFTDVMKTLQIRLFMQNEPKFQKVKYDVNNVLTKDYEQMDTWSIGKNEPKTNPNEPKTKPIKANKMPKQTQNEPKQTQLKPIYDYPCIFELAVYNLVLRYDNLIHSIPNCRNFDGEYIKWQMRQEQTQ